MARENETETEDLPILADDTETDQEAAADESGDDDEDDYNILSEMDDDERHVLSMLTDEERIAIGDMEEEPDPDQEEGAEAGADEGDEGAGDEGEEADKPGDNAPETAESTDEAEKSEAPQVELTQEDYNQIKEEFKGKKADLREKWRDGDLTDEEFDQQSDALDDAREDAVAQARQAKADQAKQEARQAEVDTFLEEARGYFKDFPDLKEKTHIQDFDRHVQAITASPRYDSMTPRQKLEAAHRLYVREGQEFGFSVPGADQFAQAQKKPAEQQKAKQDQKPAAKPANKRRPEAPKTLANVPAAATNSAVDGKYGQLEHIMMHGTVEEQMAALDRLSDDERERFASMMVGDE